MIPANKVGTFLDQIALDEYMQAFLDRRKFLDRLVRPIPEDMFLDQAHSIPRPSNHARSEGPRPSITAPTWDLPRRRSYEAYLKLLLDRTQKSLDLHVDKLRVTTYND